jgi:DnaJ-class molecular chaperone
LFLKLYIILLRQGEGRVVITASFDSKTVHVRLPTIEKVTELWNFLEILFEELMCCEDFYTSQRMVGACSKCSKQGLQPVAIKKEDCEVSGGEGSLTDNSGAMKRRWSSESSDSNSRLGTIVGD